MFHESQGALVPLETGQVLYASLTRKSTKAQSLQVTCPRSHSWSQAIQLHSSYINSRNILSDSVVKRTVDPGEE